MAHKILIVDDEQATVTMLSHRLKSSGYDVVIAKDAKSCLAQLESEKPDLILLDIVLPDVDGLHLCQAIKSDKKTARTKVIVCTNKLFVVDAAQARECGADELMEKLGDATLLLSAIRKLLGEE